jgi:ParB-like chromosome segregation protein Spo0J
VTVAVPGLTVDEVPIDDLRPDPANPRRISEDELEALTRSLRQFGFVQPVLARRGDGVVVGGHQRLVAARRLGLATVPVVWLDVSVDEARLLGLALNKISGSWDEQLLVRLLADLDDTDGLDLSLSGFDEDEIAGLVKRLDAREKRERPETFDLDAALEAARREPRTKPGELWRLGDHRLLCGDATKATDVDRLLSGRRADMAFTDPPYNVSLGDHGGQGRAAATGDEPDAEAPAATKARPRRAMPKPGRPGRDRPYTHSSVSCTSSPGRPSGLAGPGSRRPAPERR